MIAVAMTMLVHGVAERGDDAHRQHEQRKRHDGVGDAADDAVGPAAEEAGGDAGEPAHQEHQRDRGDRDGDVEPRRDDDAAEDVAAELVGAEPVRRRRRLQRRRRCRWPADRRARSRGRRSRANRISDQQAEGEAGDRILADHIAGMLERSRRSPRACARDAAGSTAGATRTACVHAHPSSLTRGSMTP